MKSILIRLFACTLPLCIASSPAGAAWPHDPNNGNVALCTAVGGQNSPMIVSDGAGGAIVTWYDSRSGSSHIYVQRVNAAGTPQWTANGVALCTAAGVQTNPTIASDGAGGAIVTWYDGRSGTSYDIYAQRVNAAGTPQWTADGVALCVATNNQYSPTIASDGAGGAIVTWYDIRGGASHDIYAQRVNAAGTPQWTADGVALCVATNSQYNPTIVSDGAGGAIVSWYDYRSGAPDIYAQRVNAAGVPQWTGDGVALCTAAYDQFSPAIASDGAGGAIVTWYDLRSGTNYDIYAQRVNAAGTPQWTTNGVALCTAANNQYYPTIASDGAAGAIVAWQDYRGGPSSDIYAQHVNAAGTPQWITDGVALCTAFGDQVIPTIASDGAGGAIVTWQDYRASTQDIYAQRVNATGTPQWTSDGVALCKAIGGQYAPTIASDGAEGAIIAWYDFRSGTSTDIYAQRIERFGQLGSPEAVIISALDVPNDQGGKVKVVWTPSYLDSDPLYGIYSYYIWRSVPPNVAADAIARGASLVSAGAEPKPGTRAFMIRRFGSQSYAWEYVGSQIARGFANYSYVVSTTSDSVTAGNPLTGFLVEANSSSSNAFWDSAPGSGYSVDNLPPFAPAPFSGTYSSGTAALHWRANSEIDLANYRLYRGTTSGFAPSPANRIAAPTDTLYSDAAGQTYYYKLSAVDIHGNESGFTSLLPGGALDAPGGAPPRTLTLERPSPNPAFGATTLRFALPHESRMTLAIYDAAGRQVRDLVSGLIPAGEHRASWDGRDGTGRLVPSGLYFCRLVAEGRTLNRRLAAIH